MPGQMAGDSLHSAGDGELAAEPQQFARAVIAPFQYPREIQFNAELAKNAGGKLPRRVQRDAERAGAARAGAAGGT